MSQRFYAISAVAWAIVAVIGLMLLFLCSSPPWLIGLAESMTVIGALGSWLSVLIGGTARRQDEMLRLLDDIRSLLERLVSR